VDAVELHRCASDPRGSGCARNYITSLRSLTFDYLYRWALFNRDWAERAEAELRRWRNTGPSPAKRRRALARIEAATSGHDPV
jgi:hypothetical protein